MHNRPTEYLFRLEEAIDETRDTTKWRCLSLSCCALWERLARVFRDRPYTPLIATTIPGRIVVETQRSWIVLAKQNHTMVIKASKGATSLRREYKLHLEIETAFRDVSRILKIERRTHDFDTNLAIIPRCFDFFARISWSENHETFGGHQNTVKGAAGYTMEYIRPLHEHYTKYLIRRHLSKTAQNKALKDVADSHFLIRVSLGATRPLCDQWDVHLLDRPAYADHLLSERTDINSLAATMGATLAVLHWRCGVDAQGVDFVIGCDKTGQAQLWLFDFGDCHVFGKTELEVKTHLVDAIVWNAPLWPKWINVEGMRKSWTAFRTEYLKISRYVLEKGCASNELRELPGLFIDELEKVSGPKPLLA